MPGGRGPERCRPTVRTLLSPVLTAFSDSTVADVTLGSRPRSRRGFPDRSGQPGLAGQVAGKACLRGRPPAAGVRPPDADAGHSGTDAAFQCLPAQRSSGPAFRGRPVRHFQTGADAAALRTPHSRWPRGESPPAVPQAGRAAPSESLPASAQPPRHQRHTCALCRGWGSCWRADWMIMTIRERSRRYIQYDPDPPHLADEPIARRCSADPVHPAPTVLTGPTCHTLPRGKERHRNPSCGHVYRSTIFA